LFDEYFSGLTASNDYYSLSSSFTKLLAYGSFLWKNLATANLISIVISSLLLAGF